MGSCNGYTPKSPEEQQREREKQRSKNFYIALFVTFLAILALQFLFGHR